MPRSTLSLGVCALLVASASACSTRAPAKAAAVDTRGTTAPHATRVGDRISPFEVERLDRTAPRETIAIPAGAKLTLIDYFGTFCPNSRRWLASLEAMRRKYPDLAIVGVATDPEPDRAGILAFATAERATFPIAWDPGRVVANAVPPPAYQSLVILDRRGVVVHTHVGTHEGVWEEVEAKVKVLLEAAR